MDDKTVIVNEQYIPHIRHRLAAFLREAALVALSAVAGFIIWVIMAI